ncbi:MAG: hypothetical protein A2X56_04160 [Nitrospirae bacterium GWC2_57_13]|jgi:nucleoside 2-deoxyribosyltransferase|nr:MAG: hypothetical protein A2X56_04160 [Nitrospirae bacterium GWC2_57_13]OGW44712.1 MAG: hypothetical protein A2X57_03075 [Nitrospirae bacterium GWD2_57_8]HAR46554.1 hypothetical protein [Nitrospiraceae bacterium]HAS52880.1 hypothetical protein [Nitrospiraceae bacterium]
MIDVNCRICQTKAAIIEAADFGRHKGYKCPVCGPYFITSTAEAMVQGKPRGSMLSSWIRDHYESNLSPPEISSDILEDVLKNITNRSPLEKQLLLLRAIEKRTDYPGAKVSLNLTHDYPLAWASNPDELRYLVKSLEDRRFVAQDKTIGTSVLNVVILTDGWVYLDSHATKSAFKDRAFIAMSFDKSLDALWENGIKIAVERAGYKPHRVDKEPHLDRIDAKIIADIKDSAFMIADVTQQKQGVYFEAGYALGLKRPIIWCVREDDLDNVHFDTRQYNHVVWKTAEDLQEQLYNLICAVLGKRTHS